MTDPTDQGVEHSFWVLVVEDEFFIAMELETALLDGGYSVLGPASSVKGALDLLTGQRPDAAVLDVNLGRERVTPVALRLQALGVPFFLASASNSSDLAWDAVLAGAPNFGKPTDLKRLLNAVDALPRGATARPK